MKPIVEICCGSYSDALSAAHAGATRIELNSALSLGGLTPSLATLIKVKQDTSLKVIAMVRPRGAGFCYSDEEYEIMKEDAKIMLDHGVDGLAFGFLDKQEMIDEKRTLEFVQLIHRYHKEAVFHRAFDCVNDPFQAIEKLIDLQVDRVLTSGLKSKAIESVELLSKLQQQYGNQIEILVGSGVNKENVLEILDKTKVHQVHSSCKDWIEDVTTSMHDVSFAYAPFPHENDYEIVSEELVKTLLDVIKSSHF